MAVCNRSNIELLAIFELFFDEYEEEIYFFEHLCYNKLFRLLTRTSRDSVPKINNYMEVVDQMSTVENIDDFKFHYRMCKQTFEVILAEIALDLIHYNTGGNVPISPDRQLLVFLNYVGNQHSMRNCAHFFGMSKATVHDIINRVINSLLKLRTRIIRWPSPDRQREIGRDVHEKYGIPGVVARLFRRTKWIRRTNWDSGNKCLKGEGVIFGKTEANMEIQV
ncbi:uncharacterized protein LOC134230253 [Saccostrea cucullata]|uniref:uncharacterized protein LOC134230253 n=1 Tax=Saccostrea cuccullata TaxID=36930 RepID=UPI002ED40232